MPRRSRWLRCVSTGLFCSSIGLFVGVFASFDGSAYLRYAGFSSRPLVPVAMSLLLVC